MHKENEQVTFLNPKCCFITEYSWEMTFLQPSRPLKSKANVITSVLSLFHNLLKTQQSESNKTVKLYSMLPRLLEMRSRKTQMTSLWKDKNKVLQTVTNKDRQERAISSTVVLWVQIGMLHIDLNIQLTQPNITHISVYYLIWSYCRIQKRTPRYWQHNSRLHKCHKAQNHAA